MSDADEFFGGGASSLSFADRSTLNVWRGGTILAEPRQVQQRDYITKEPKFWPDGNKMMALEITLQTEERNPQDPEDTGIRRLFVQGQMKSAVQNALTTARAPMAPGGQIWVMWVGEQPSTKGGNPAKIYKSHYVPGQPGAQASDFFGSQNDQPAQSVPPVQQPQQQPWAQPQGGPAGPPAGPPANQQPWVQPQQPVAGPPAQGPNQQPWMNPAAAASNGQQPQNAYATGPQQGPPAGPPSQQPWVQGAPAGPPANQQQQWGPQNGQQQGPPQGGQPNGAPPAWTQQGPPQGAPPVPPAGPPAGPPAQPQGAPWSQQPAAGPPAQPQGAPWGQPPAGPPQGGQVYQPPAVDPANPWPAQQPQYAQQ